MDLDRYAEDLVEAGLSHRVEELLAAARVSVRWRPRPLDRALDVGRSRYLGHPDLAVGAEWPAPKGQPLSFVAQVQLADAPSEATNPWLPSDGMLHFFYDFDAGPWGFDPADRGGWAVTYTPSGAALDTTAPPTSVAEALGSPMTLVPDVDNTVVPWESFDAERLLDQDDLLRYQQGMPEDDDYNELEPVHRLLGYPDIIQNDMQLECQLASNGLYCGDDSGYEDPRADVLKPGAAAWRLLMQIDSDDEAGLSFGDMGRLYFWMTEADLRARAWNSAWMILQCG